MTVEEAIHALDAALTNKGCRLEEIRVRGDFLIRYVWAGYQGPITVLAPGHTLDAHPFRLPND